MGDRTTVTLYIPAVCTPAVQALLEQIGHPPDDLDIGTGDALTHFLFYDVNYGNLEFLDQLLAQGIPFDSEWQAGDEYGPGGEYLRFTPEGEAVRKELYDSQRNPDLEDLMTRLDDYDKLRQFILYRYAKVAVLPWDNQVEYGRIYRTRQLIQVPD